MTEDATTPPVRRGLTEKRRAVMDGALRVFAREGYTRGSIGEIAKEAGVSTRTIYNHFADKDELFRTVIAHSAARVREQHLDLVDRHLGAIVDVEADLRSFARAIARSGRDFPEHFALVRQVNAEVGHLPHEVITAWRAAGPRPVHAAIARRLAESADKGLLTIEDPKRATVHLLLLTGTEISNRTFMGALPIAEAEVEAIVDAGLEVFLRAYGPRT